MDTIDIPKAVKEAVHRVDPGATVILYGSRARGDARPDSDWDFMVLHDFAPSDEAKNRLHELLLAIEIETGQVLVAIHRTKREWNSLLYQVMPFHQNVVREGQAV